MPTPVDMNQPIAYWSTTGIVFSEMPKAIEHAINLLPNLNLVQGTVLGEVSATLGTFGPYAGSTVASPAAITPTLTTSSTGGFLPASTTYYVVFTYINGVGETVKSTEASIATAAGTSTNTITVATPTTLPSNAVGIKVYMGTVSGTDYYVGTTPYTTYTITSPASSTAVPPGASTAIAATNGQQNARCVLRYSCSTDANGNILIGNSFATTTGSPVYTVGSNVSASFGPFAAAQPCIDAIFGGAEFSLSDIIGLDSAAISAGFGRIEDGVLGGPGRFLLT